MIRLSRNARTLLKLGISSRAWTRARAPDASLEHPEDELDRWDEPPDEEELEPFTPLEQYVPVEVLK